MRFSAAFSGLLAAITLAPPSALAAPPDDVAAPLAPSAAAPRTPAPLLPAPAAPDLRLDEPNVTGAFLAGVAVSLIPLTFGGVLATSGAEHADKNTGLLIAGAGFALAPMVSHAVLREWKRGLLFSILPVASEVAMTTLLTRREDAVFKGTTLSRTTFALLFSFDVFGSALGLVDVLMAGDRAKKRGFMFAPSISRTRIGFTLGGSL